MVIKIPKRIFLILFTLLTTIIAVDIYFSILLYYPSYISVSKIIIEISLISLFGLYWLFDPFSNLWYGRFLKIAIIINSILFCIIIGESLYSLFFPI